MYSPRVTALCNQAFVARKQLKQDHSEWIVFMKYPGLYVKTEENAEPYEYNWQRVRKEGHEEAYGKSFTGLVTARIFL